MFKRAKILSYDAKKRTAQIHIPGLTDGASEGITATFAYPIGDDDRQTERQIIIGNDVFIFFENNNQEFPVIAHYSSHSNGALVDVRRIQQKNVEIIGEKEILLDAPKIRLKGQVIIDGPITQENGNFETDGKVTAKDDVIGGGKSLKSHTHSGVRSGNSSTLKPD